jgi:hypothetical protein
MEAIMRSSYWVLLLLLTLSAGKLRGQARPASLHFAAAQDGGCCKRVAAQPHLLT